MIKQMVKPKSVFIETYGCQMNVYDTELIKSILLENNFSIAMQEDGADIVMLNTCSVRDNANRKIYNRVHEIKYLYNSLKNQTVNCDLFEFIISDDGSTDNTKELVGEWQKE